MKKLMLLAAMLALVVVAASPAFAQGKAEDSIIQDCPAEVTIGDENVGTQTVVNSQEGDIVITGDRNEVSIEQELVQRGFSPEVAAVCAQEIAQAAAAGGGQAEAKAGGAQAQAGGTSAKAELPKTGGGASLFALGAGALLVGGGLVARRIIK